MLNVFNIFAYSLFTSKKKDTIKPKIGLIGTSFREQTQKTSVSWVQRILRCNLNISIRKNYQREYASS